MCLSVPARIEAITGDMADVVVGGVRYRANITLIDSAKVGDYVLLHAGFAIQKLDKGEAKKTLQLFERMARITSPRGKPE